MKLANDATVSLALADEKRIEDAIEALRKDAHAPRTLLVTVTLHVHNEYPKVVGGKIVNSEEEEQAALAAAPPDDAVTVSNTPAIDETPQTSAPGPTLVEKPVETPPSVEAAPAAAPTSDTATE